MNASTASSIMLQSFCTLLALTGWAVYIIGCTLLLGNQFKELLQVQQLVAHIAWTVPQFWEISNHYKTLNNTHHWKGLWFYQFCWNLTSDKTQNKTHHRKGLLKSYWMHTLVLKLDNNPNSIYRLKGPCITNLYIVGRISDRVDVSEVNVSDVSE